MKPKLFLFGIFCGILQGCPLSGTIFACCLDFFLRWFEDVMATRSLVSSLGARPRGHGFKATSRIARGGMYVFPRGKECPSRIQPATRKYEQLGSSIQATANLVREVSRMTFDVTLGRYFCLLGAKPVIPFVGQGCVVV